MNSRERITTVMNNKQPDRIPIWCLLSLQHIVEHGTPNGKIPSTIEELVQAECTLIKRYNFDGHLVYFPAMKKNQKVAELLDKMIFGVPKGDSEHVLETADPDSWLLNVPDYNQEDFYSSHLTREILGEEHHIGSWIADGYSRALQWFPSLEEASMALLTDPVRFNSLVNYHNEVSIAEVVAQIKFGGIESVQISSPYAGSSFISLESYNEFVFDSISKLAAAITEAGAKSYIHTCGFISDRLELLAETGTDGIECMDPPPLGNVTLADAKKRVGSRIFLKGNIDSVNVLLQGDDDYYKKTVKETIEVGKEGGGYILSTACSVAPNVHPDRLIQLTKMVDKFGIY